MIKPVKQYEPKYSQKVQDENSQSSKKHIFYMCEYIDALVKKPEIEEVKCEIM